MDLRIIADMESLAPTRDQGLLEGAAGRPTVTMFGDDLYPTLALKAAALMHGIITSHPLIDGNKRLGWLACVVFLGRNRVAVNAKPDDAFDLVIAVATHELKTVEEIATVLIGWMEPA